MVIISSSMAPSLLLLGLLFPFMKPTEAQIGVCYGRDGNNLPSERSVVNLYKSNGISRMRLYDPDQASLQALRGSSIGVILGVPNDSLRSLGSDASAASRWVQSNVVAYASSVNFRYIAVGNEVKPGDANANFVLPAMQNVQNALNAANLGQIKVSTAVESSLLTNTFPPSASVFSDAAKQHMGPILSFLKSHSSPLLTNIYPYFSLVGNRASIHLDYALFAKSNAEFTDPRNGLSYQNLFDALVDSFYAALENAGAGSVGIVVSESGWPSQGTDVATAANAATYYRNLIGHVRNGTPKKKGVALETYLFAMFDENLKPGAEVEKHFGLFTPSQQKKYQISFG